MDPEKALLLRKKPLNRYSFSNLRRTVIIFIAISIIAGSVYYCLSCGASEMMQALKSTSEWSDESDEDHGRREPVYSIDWGTEDEIAMDNKFYTRKYNLQQKCRELNVQRESKFQKFIINRGNSIIYCNVFGVVSSAWLNYFNLLLGYDEDYVNKPITSDDLFARNRNSTVSSAEFEWIALNYLSFIVVRHPYVRLVNIYIEKFILNSHSEWSKKIGGQIILTTRAEVEKNGFGKIRKFEYPPTFEEFVRFILCQWKNNRTIDEHWIPAAIFCTPCQVDFQLILKFETLEDERIFLEKRAGLEDMEKLVEPIAEKPVLDEEVDDLMKEYFSQISKQQILELDEYYKKGFELFGYDSGKKYLEFGQEVHTSQLCLNLPQD